MRVLRVFLRPGWLLTTAVVVAFAAACFLVLAPWQLGKNSETEHRNDLIRAAGSVPAVPIDELAPPGTGLDPETEWRTVTVTGEYLADEQVLIRLRSADQRPAADVVTPLRIAGSDRVVLINRGWIRPEADGSIQVPAPPAGTVSVEARLRRAEGTSPGKEPRIEDGRLSAYTVDPAQFAAFTGLTLDPMYLQITPDQPGSLGEIALPQLESGPYLSYGLQWLAFGIMAPLGVGYFIWAEVKHRRALKRKQDGETVDEPVPSDSRTSERRSEKNRIRDQLQAAGTQDHATQDHATQEHASGRQAESSGDEVATKLARRYGR